MKGQLDALNISRSSNGFDVKINLLYYHEGSLMRQSDLMFSTTSNNNDNQYQLPQTATTTKNTTIRSHPTNAA